MNLHDIDYIRLDVGTSKAEFCSTNLIPSRCLRRTSKSVLIERSTNNKKNKFIVSNTSAHYITVQCMNIWQVLHDIWTDLISHDFIVSNFCSSITLRKCPYVLSHETDENIQLEVLEERFRQLSQPCFVPSVTKWF